MKFIENIHLKSICRVITEKGTGKCKEINQYCLSNVEKQIIHCLRGLFGSFMIC